MKIFLIRHGESTSDIEERYGGHYDDHLTGRGKSQSRRVAKKLANKKVEVIFSSPFHRAMETSDILSKEWACPVIVVDSIKERDRYAHLTGMKKSLAAKRHAKHVGQLKTYLHEVEGGEKYGDFKERIMRAFDEISASPHHVIALVCHGGPIGCIVRELLGRETKYIGKCAWFEINKGKHELKLAKFGHAGFEKRKKFPV